MTCQPIDIYAEDPTCAMTAEDHLEQIADLLPQGRAWPRDPNSTLMRYWRAVAEVIKYAEDRICTLGDQFYCSTALESIEIWTETYGVELPDNLDLDPACLIAGADPVEDIMTQVCVRVASTGGNGELDIEAAALALGFVINIIDTSDTKVAMAGCFEVGCAQLGPKGVMAGGSCLGQESLPNGAWTGRAVDHPQPEFWTRELAWKSATCGTIPGTELGQSTVGPDCCMMAGYYGGDESVVVTASACRSDPVTGPFLANYTASAGDANFPRCITTESVFAPYTGNAYHFKVEVDLPATLILQQSRSNVVELFTQSGCLIAGNECNPLRDIILDPLYQLIEDMKPAHTAPYYDLIYT